MVGPYIALRKLKWTSMHLPAHLRSLWPSDALTWLVSRWVKTHKEGRNAESSCLHPGSTIPAYRIHTSHGVGDQNDSQYAQSSIYQKVMKSSSIILLKTILVPEISVNKDSTTTTFSAPAQLVSRVVHLEWQARNAEARCKSLTAILGWTETRFHWTREMSYLLISRPSFSYYKKKFSFTHS